MFLRKRENFAGKMQAPKPVLGTCANTGEWKKPSMVNDCIECVNNYGAYGESQFYCNGKCMSEYNSAQICSLKSLVAENEGQCYQPCYQEGAPRLSNKAGKGACTLDAQCGDGYKCLIDRKSGKSNCVLATTVTDENVFKIPDVPISETDENEVTFPVSENFENEGEYNYSRDMYSTRGGFYDQKTKLFIGVL